MPAYQFVTEWRLRAPIDAVFAVVDATDEWPEWWPQVRAVSSLADGGADGLGTMLRMDFVGRLPYHLRFDLRVVERMPPTRLAGDATGELEGRGEWTLRDEAGWTVVRYVWAVRTTRAWMNVFAPLPFVDEIFRMNHHAVMRGGLRGIRQRLGGVEGGYTRIE